MAVIAEIAASVTARTSNFEKGMKRARRNLKRFVGGLPSAVKRVAAFGAALAAVGAAGTAVLVKRQMAAIDSTGKLAARLGIATEELIGFRHAAELTGAGTATLDSALQRMVRRVGKVAQGSGEASRALDVLGLKASDLAKMGTAESFKVIAERLQSVEGAFNKTAIASRIFGNEGEALILTLSDGRKGLEAAVKEAERLGLTYSNIDASKIAAANDALFRMGQLIKGASTQLAIQLAPWVEAIAVKLTDMGARGLGAGKAIVVAFETVAQSAAKASAWIDRIKSTFHSVRAAALTAIQSILRWLDRIAHKIADTLNWLHNLGLEVNSNIAQMADGLGQVIAEEVAKADAALKRFNTGAASREVGAFFDDLRNKADAAARAAVERTERMQGMVGSAGFAEAAEQASRIEQMAERVIDATRTPMEKYEKTIGDLNEILRAGAIDWETYSRGVRQARESLESAVKGADEWGRISERIISETRTPMEQYQAQLEKLNELISRGRIDWDTYGRAVKQAREQLEALSGASTFQQGKLSRMAIGSNHPNRFSRSVDARSQMQWQGLAERAQVKGLERGRQRKQEVHDPQLKKIDKTLEKIAKNTKRSPAAVLR